VTKFFREQSPLAWTFHRNTCLQPTRASGVVLEPENAPFKEYLSAPTLPLPSSGWAVRELRDCIAGRRSCRQFAGTSISLVQLAHLLQSAYGSTCPASDGLLEFIRRPVPSAGALYPLELYLVVMRVEGVAPGIYHYAAADHLLEQVRAENVAAHQVSALFGGQSWFGEAAVIVVLTAIPLRSLWKYGERGYRYILIEAGHVAQNLNLVAVEVGLGSANVGAFFDSALTQFLELDDEVEFPLYAVAVGDEGPRA
jgi:SagB-type dehydrogenase family enzyme